MKCKHCQCPPKGQNEKCCSSDYDKLINEYKNISLDELKDLIDEINNKTK